jgi:hypothetical protein
MRHFSYCVRKSLNKISSAEIFCTVFKGTLVPLALELSHPASCSSGKASNLYSRVLGSNSARDIDYLSDIFRGFPQSLYAGIVY